MFSTTLATFPDPPEKVNLHKDWYCLRCTRHKDLLSTMYTPQTCPVFCFP